MAKRFIRPKFLKDYARTIRASFVRVYGCDFYSQKAVDLGSDEGIGGDIYDATIRDSQAYEALMSASEGGVDIPLLDHKNLKRLLDALNQARADSILVRPEESHEAEAMLDGFNHRKRIDSLIKLIEKTLTEV